MRACASTTHVPWAMLKDMAFMSAILAMRGKADTQTDGDEQGWRRRVKRACGT